MEGRRESLIREINRIYQERGYRRQGRPLREFGEQALEQHLAKLQAGEYRWISNNLHRLKTCAIRKEAVDK